MKKYYDREFQLDQLKSIQKKAFEEHSRMTLLKGRRRIGKTTLGRLSIEGADSVYLFVARKSESDLCEAFSNEIRTALNAFLPTGVTRFRELFEWLLAEGERRPFNLFIDEFQEFYYINPSVACQSGTQRLLVYPDGKNLQGPERAPVRPGGPHH